jgi:two-component system cell cycle sensor histidine kinase/response regulator CckA
MWDVNKRVVEWNLTAEHIFGYTFEDAAGQSFEDLIVPESVRPQVDRVWAGLLTASGGVRSTNENTTRQGRHIICDWYNTPLIGADGKVMGVASLVQDVTEVKRLEEELRQSQKMEAIGRLASGVAHDFSSLLTAISGFTSLARRTLSPQHPAVRSLDRVDEAARQAVGVTKSLLTFSRGGGGAPKSPVHLGKAVEDAARLLRRMLPANVVLGVRVGPEDVYVHGDTTQLQQVVMNLAINARDAMPRGGTLTIAVQVQPDQAVRKVLLSVTDTGSGMSPDVQSHIFEPFYTTKPPGEGTGLGLAITHAIIKDHGGRIEVESAPGKGTTFRIVLPVISAPDPDEQPGDGLSAPALPGQGQQVLLTSGRAFLRELMASSLTSMGFQVVQLSDLEGSAAAATTRGFKVHIVDVETLGIPDQDVVDRAKQIPGILTTIYLVGEANSSAVMAGTGSVTIPKPFQISDLAGAVSEALK